MLKKLSDAERKSRTGEEERRVADGKLTDAEREAAAAAKSEEEKAEEAAAREAGRDYEKFWTYFAKSVKMGVIEDTGNR